MVSKILILLITSLSIFSCKSQSEFKRDSLEVINEDCLFYPQKLEASTNNKSFFSFLVKNNGNLWLVKYYSTTEKDSIYIGKYNHGEIFSGIKGRLFLLVENEFYEKVIYEIDANNLSIIQYNMLSSDLFEWDISKTDCKRLDSITQLATKVDDNNIKVARAGRNLTFNNIPLSVDALSIVDYDNLIYSYQERDSVKIILYNIDKKLKELVLEFPNSRNVKNSFLKVISTNKIAYWYRTEEGKTYYYIIDLLDKTVITSGSFYGLLTSCIYNELSNSFYWSIMIESECKSNYMLDIHSLSSKANISHDFKSLIIKGDFSKINLKTFLREKF